MAVTALDWDDEPISCLCLALPVDPKTSRNASLKYISKSLGLSSKKEAKDLLESDAIQEAFAAYSSSFLRSHPRAPGPHLHAIRNLFSLSRLYQDQDKDGYFEGLLEEFPDHADSRGAEFTWKVVQFLASDECKAKWDDIADLSTWELNDACELCVAMLCILQRAWQANYQQRLKADGQKLESGSP